MSSDRIRDRPTAPRSPWQNGNVERLIGSIRRESLDHLVVLAEAHLRDVLKAYASYYNKVRPRLSLDKDAPDFHPKQKIGRRHRSRPPAVPSPSPQATHWGVKSRRPSDAITQGRTKISASRQCCRTYPKGLAPSSCTLCSSLRSHQQAVGSNPTGSPSSGRSRKRYSGRNDWRPPRR